MTRSRSATTQRKVGTLAVGRVLVLIAVGLMILPVPNALAQGAKPDFSGNWVLDKSKSDFGQGPQPDDMSEVIEHHEPKMVITTTTTQGGAENTRSVNYTTDGVENVNMVNGHQMKTKSHWEGASLVTVVRDEAGLQLTEVRTLSKDGKAQTVETDFGMGKQKLVLVKK